MQPDQTKYQKVRDLPPSAERGADRLGRIAGNDVYFGGARALLLLRRLERSPNYYLYAAAVTEAYHTDYAREHTFWDCPECGAPVFGRTAASVHCADAIFGTDLHDPDTEMYILP